MNQEIISQEIVTQTTETVAPINHTQQILSPIFKDMAGQIPPAYDDIDTLNKAKALLAGMVATPATCFSYGDLVYFPEHSQHICIIGADKNDPSVIDTQTGNSLSYLQDHTAFLWHDGKWCLSPNQTKRIALGIYHATLDNYELLSQLHPYVSFENPPAKLSGNELTRYLIDSGKRRVFGYASNTEPNDLTGHETLAKAYNDNGFYTVDGNFYTYFVPADMNTGEPLFTIADYSNYLQN